MMNDTDERTEKRDCDERLLSQVHVVDSILLCTDRRVLICNVLICIHGSGNVCIRNDSHEEDSIVRWQCHHHVELELACLLAGLLACWLAGI